MQKYKYFSNKEFEYFENILERKLENKRNKKKHF